MCSPALAQEAVQAPVISAGPGQVSVTLYRDPDRGDGAINRQRPTSFALIAETRTVTLPPGEVVVRFEGVASGIVPQSAILFGTSPRERNRDAALLSQSGLVDAFTGQQVILRRTDPATGKTVEETATIRSAADRLVVTTPRGVEAMYCTGLNQTLIYPHAPATLSDKPVLSMTTKDQPGGTITITLAYIATGFDWDATYVGTLAPDGQSMSLLGWLTMVSGDDTSFVDATTSAVAGKINRSDETQDDIGADARDRAGWLNREYSCWPRETTSDVRTLLPPPVPAPMTMAMDESIVVTARRREEKLQDVPIAISAIAKAENLGDLKLYRIPMSVTVAARSQKQVAFMVANNVNGKLIYRSRVSGDTVDDPQMLFRFRNRKQDGLGEPVPAGRAIIYQSSTIGRMLVGESQTPDKAIDEEVEWAFGKATNVTIDTDEETDDSDITRHEVTLRNANPFPVHFEVEFPLDNENIHFHKLPGRLIRKPGKRIWTAILPANDSIVLRYRTSEPKSK